MMEPLMRDGLDFKKQDFVPAVKDASWSPLTAALLESLGQQDMTIDDIVAWGRSQGHSGALIRHMLAWLSFTNQVFYDARRKLWCSGPEPMVAAPDDPCQDDLSHDD